MNAPGRLCGELKMNINLLEPENKSFMVRKISNVNLPLNPEVDKWIGLHSDTLKTFSTESGESEEEKFWPVPGGGGGREWKPEKCHIIWTAFPTFPLLLYFSHFHYEFGLRCAWFKELILYESCPSAFYHNDYMSSFKKIPLF
jgi:hypothetical protein